MVFNVLPESRACEAILFLCLPIFKPSVRLPSFFLMLLLPYPPTLLAFYPPHLLPFFSPHFRVFSSTLLLSEPLILLSSYRPILLPSFSAPQNIT